MSRDNRHISEGDHFVDVGTKRAHMSTEGGTQFSSHQLTNMQRMIESAKLLGEEKVVSFEVLPKDCYTTEPYYVTTIDQVHIYPPHKEVEGVLAYNVPVILELKDVERLRHFVFAHAAYGVVLYAYSDNYTESDDPTVTHVCARPLIGKDQENGHSELWLTLELSAEVGKNEYSYRLEWIEEEEVDRERALSESGMSLSDLENLEYEADDGGEIEYEVRNGVKLFVSLV